MLLGNDGSHLHLLPAFGVRPGPGLSIEVHGIRQLPLTRGVQEYQVNLAGFATSGPVGCAPGCRVWPRVAGFPDADSSEPNPPLHQPLQSTERISDREPIQLLLQLKPVRQIGSRPFHVHSNSEPIRLRLPLFTRLLLQLQLHSSVLCGGKLIQLRPQP